jgi:hypothetical protein
MTDPVLETLWKRVVDHWDDDAAHGAFLTHCQETDQLLEAAVRYRGMAGDRDRGPAAERRLGGVAMLAMAKLESSRTRPAEARRNAGKLVLVIFFTAASAALAYYALTPP